MVLHVIVSSFTCRNQSVTKKKNSLDLMGPLEHNVHLDLVTTKTNIIT